MKKSLQFFKTLCFGLCLFITPYLKGQIVNPIADSVYNGWIKAYLIKSGNQTYFANSLTNREMAFFWGQAYMIVTAEDAYDGYPTPARKKLITDLLNTFLLNNSSDWSWDSWNDDVQWGILATIRGYKITGNTAYLKAAIYNWDMNYNRGWDGAYGGGLWENMDAVPDGGKCGLSNWPQVIGGCMIYEATGNSDYLTKCKSIYSWARTHVYDPNTGKISEQYGPQGMFGDDNSYNYGLMINSANALYKNTKDTLYYNDAIAAAEHYIGKIGGLESGIMTEDHPLNGGFGCDQFARGLSIFASDNYLWSRYWQFLANNCTAAWSHRRTDYNFTWNNFSTITGSSKADSLWAMAVQGSVTVQMATPVIQTITDTIEAEKYNFMNGVHVDVIDAGGKCVDSLATGDWMEYLVKIPATGMYKLTYRISGTNPGSLQLLQNNIVVDVTNLPETGNLQSYKVVSSSVKLSSGIQSIKIKALTGGWNIDKWIAKSCSSITPAISVNGAAAQQTTFATISEGDNIFFNPLPADGTWNWKGPNEFVSAERQLSINNIQLNQGGIYTAIYNSPDVCSGSQDFILTLEGCHADSIIPYIKVNNDSLRLVSSITMNAGGYILIAPYPADGTWSWTGPNGFTSNTRKISLNSLTFKQAGNYIATYFNANGCKSTKIFTVLITGTESCGTPINPYTKVTLGAWLNVNYATLNVGDYFTLGPQPNDNNGWQWTGPNGYTAASKEITINSFSAAKAGYYTATYVNSAGCKSSCDFLIGLNDCTANSIIPTIMINGVQSAKSDSIILHSGGNFSIYLPIKPSDGKLHWTGPNGFSSDSTKITFTNILNWVEGQYTATFFNTSACKCTYTVYIKVLGNCSSPIVPYIQINNGSWLNINSATLKIGDNISLGPQPKNGIWSWTGPGGYLHTTRGVDLKNITVAQGGIYTAKYINTIGCLSFMDFTLTVNKATGLPGISEFDNSGIYIYPNPATDFVILKRIPVNTEISIVDLSGQILIRKKSIEAGDVNINIQELKTGVYLMQVGTAGNKGTFKLIKK